MSPTKDQAFAADLPRLEAELAGRYLDQSNAVELHGPLDPRMVRWLRAARPRSAGRR